MTSIKDVEVTIDVQHPASIIGLGKPLILVGGAAVDFKEYTTLEAVEGDFAQDTETYKLAQSILVQANKPNKLCIATYKSETPGPGETLTDVLEKYYEKDWHFALLAGSTETERLAMSNVVELHDFKFAVVQVDTTEEIAAFKNNAHTIVYYHTNAGERLDGAVIGDAANLTVGSITWKGRHNLNGITPIEITADELEAIHAAGANAYVTKAGVPQTSEGLTATDEYIDFYHGRDWIKATAETELQTLLIVNPKIPPNPKGISMISTTMANVLTKGGKKGIIEVNDEGAYLYTINTLPWSEIDPEDRKKRIYSGMTFDYEAQGATHKIKVKGSVVSNA